MEYGCIGKKLPHSFSKVIHEKFGKYPYELLELTEQELTGFMTERPFKAINVTIPYKEAVIPFLYHMSEKAAEIGAVNTVINKDGRLYGYNTDFYGMSALIEKSGVSIKDKKVAVLGSGGTSKTAFSVANALGASQVIRVGRKEKDSCITYESLYENHADTQVIIKTTPVGMFPEIYACPVDIDRFSDLCLVVDAVYNPLNTMLVSKAKEKGITAVGGLYMLISQAVKAYELFTESEAEPGLTDTVYSGIYSEKSNIVLAGMPSCGKTTAGKALAQKLNREFIDTDDEIIKKIGMPIAEYFKKYGEKSFRDTESEVIKEISKRSGVVIATGGGAVLRKENVEKLKMNGVIYFIDCPLSCLGPTSDRPLASDMQAMKKIYDERHET